MAVGEGEDRVVGRQHHVAGQRQADPETRAGPAHGGQHWLAHRAHLGNDFMNGMDEGLEFTPDYRLVGLGVDRLLEIFYIAAGHEMLARAGNDDRPHTIIRRGGGDSAGEIANHRVIERVERCGTVERDGGDAVCRLVKHCVLRCRIHGHFLLPGGRRYPEPAIPARSSARRSRSSPKPRRCRPAL